MYHQIFAKVGGVPDVKLLLVNITVYSYVYSVYNLTSSIIYT